MLIGDAIDGAFDKNKLSTSIEENFHKAFDASE